MLPYADVATGRSSDDASRSTSTLNPAEWTAELITFSFSGVNTKEELYNV